MQNTKAYVDSIFNDYKESKGLDEFKEELTSHLNDKIANFIKNGFPEDDAFQKATAELGDISALADEMNLQRKQEILSEAFMDTKRFMKPWRVAAYILFGLVFAFGLICAALAFFANGMHGTIPPGSFIGNSNLLRLLGVLCVFMPIATGGFTFLLLTQESASTYPMSTKRALWYTAAIIVLTAGILIVPLTWLAVGGKENMVATIAVLIPFILPAAGLLTFLVLTEKDHKKPWVKQLREKELAWLTNPEIQQRFGMFSGAIWITAIALCILLGIIVSFKVSWICFLFAIAAQLFVQGVMMKTNSNEEIKQ